MMDRQRAGQIYRGLLVWGALAAALAGQLAVNSHLKPLRPVIDELPYPPSPLAMKAISLGDDQFLYRALIGWLQDFGDGGGRLRPLNQYDYHRVVDWLRSADRLDPASDALFALGSNYFGAISDPIAAPPRVKLIAEYFKQAGLADLEHRSTWLTWAAVKIQHNVNDPALIRQTAQEFLSLLDNEKGPYWLPLLAPALFRAAGDIETANAVEMRPEIIALRQRAFQELNLRLGVDEKP